MPTTPWFSRTRLTAGALAILAVLIASCDEECDDGSPGNEDNAGLITSVQGDGATTPSGGTVTLVAEVRDDNEAVLDDVKLSWTATGGTLTGSSTTGTDGRASSEWHLPAASGTYTATAKVTGRNLTTTFDVTVFGEQTGCNNPLVLTDDFEGADNWSATSTAGPGSSELSNLMTSEGNPTGYRFMEHFLGANSSITVFHVFDFIYEPAEMGAISHINYREDRRQLQEAFPGSAIGTAFLVVQNGTNFSSATITNGVFTSLAWETATRNGITAAAVGGANFAANAPALRFGFVRSNTNSSAEGTATFHGIDNWQVEICRVAPGPLLKDRR